MSRDYSEIVAIDTGSFQRRAVFGGRANGFYSRIRGKHQITPRGYLVITSSEQGRAFEVDPEGDVTLEVVNLSPGSETANVLLSELMWLPPDAFDFEGVLCERRAY